MAEPIQLYDQNSNELVVQEGESFNFTATFKDVSATPVALTKAQILTLTLTLYQDTTIINSRDAVSVKDANGGTVTTAGVLTMKLDPADQAIVNTSKRAGTLEEHVARLDWTWNDGQSRTGRAEYKFKVEKLSSPS